MRSPSQEAVRKMLFDEFTYYLDHQDEMVAQYDGKFIVIKGEEVVGAYDSDLEAVVETKKVHPMGTFLVQKVSPGDAGYTARFHSPIVTFV